MGDQANFWSFRYVIPFGLPRYPFEGVPAAEALACLPSATGEPRGVRLLQQAQHREHAAEDRERLCKHRTGEAPRQASLKAGKLRA